MTLVPLVGAPLRLKHDLLPIDVYGGFLELQDPGWPTDKALKQM